SWILHHFARISGDAHGHDVAHLVFEFAHTHGINTDSNLTYDEIDRSGKILRASHRLWPQTEALKAFVATAEHGPDAEAREAAGQRIAPAVDAIFDNYFFPGTGIWNDQIDATGKKVSEFVPATSLYHLFLAFAETLRFYGANRSI
ncbi:MAG: AGE family epimerase/isomerase, partial [Alphaproteobacteria bacterium]